MAGSDDLPLTAGGAGFQVELAPGDGPVPTGLPCLAGPTGERLFAAPTAAGRAGHFALTRSGPWLLGAARIDPCGDIEQATHRLYDSLLAAARGLRLARIWNYVPAINAPERDGLETYRAFCRGRSLAFETAFGREFREVIPAASAVGTDAAELTVVFAATSGALRHFENPRQVPAYEYPPEYGPRPPSFARATVVPDTTAGSVVFISGTAAIRGHASVAPGAVVQQLDCTVENLREISAACGLGPDLAAGKCRERHFKVYLRRAADFAVVRAGLEQALVTPADRVSYLRSDICRRELDVEIEATLLGATPTP